MTTKIEYTPLNRVNSAELLSVLNNSRVRTHLVSHPLFDGDSLEAWCQAKVDMDAVPGCRVRGILVDGRCVGWCGIQRTGNEFEIAIILDDSRWGLGQRVFRELMKWAKELGHRSVFLHLLGTRPAYSFLRKRATSVRESVLLEHRFTTYQLPVV